ncbi:type-F conjugative transfer system pilin assembly protein TrbC [Erwinia amylovora]|uniref:type-F conjugative transfer system pilin assembly protein TrbC n=1 Tax=Erwinia amylovora TaxID=552 RepID=UPI0020BFE8FE|nr:type-F conjugative transfer system pilin assembly protein TrbC [Erwinia amylovora]MCK8417600.1 type-F conjugative transfer system pilin assembly protein TrbC [Erwinia amylovora]
MRVSLIILSLLFSTATSAADLTKNDMDFMKQKQAELKDFKEKLSGMNIILPQSQQSLVDKNSAEIASQQKQAAEENQEPKFMYFLSFSIPNEGLLSMVNDAKKYGITPTMRGLVNNDFRETAKKSFVLSKEDKNFGFIIDPFLFRDYGVKAVPAMVITCGEKHDLVYGSLPVKEALEKVAREGDCSENAKKILATYK